GHSIAVLPIRIVAVAEETACPSHISLLRGRDQCFGLRTHCGDFPVATALFFLMIPLSAKLGLVITSIPEDSSMLRGYALGSAVALLFLPLSAFAHGWSRSSMASHYSPAMSFVDPCVIYVPVCVPQMQAHGAVPGPTPGKGPMAAPSAAPPSSGPIPSG